jgi:hypothetical protein
MRRLVAFSVLLGLGWMWWSSAGVEEPLDVELAQGFSLDVLCEDGAAAPRFGEFVWDEVRRSDPKDFEKAVSECRRCEDAPRCAPVLTVLSWYGSGHPTTQEEGR